MATWTNIPDSVLEPGKPVRSVDALALRDNAIAIAQGAAGAPRVRTNGINNSAVTTAKINNSAVTTDKIANGNVTTAKIANSNVTAAKLATGGAENNWVRARTATSTTNQVGTYAFAQHYIGLTVNPNATTAGSNLRMSGAYARRFNEGGSNFDFASSTTLSGTWRCMGYQTEVGINPGAPNANGTSATLWVRIS